MTLLVVAIVSASASRAQLWPGGEPTWSYGGCLDERATANNKSAGNCTANDLTFVLIGRGIEQDACVNPGDTADVLLRAVVRNTTAQTRYDVGVFVAQAFDSTPLDGAYTGAAAGNGGPSCAYSAILNAGPGGGFSCPGQINLAGTSFADPPQYDGSAGPYVNADGPGSFDACSDIINQNANAGCDVNGDGLHDDTVIDFVNPVTFACQDTDGDGFLNIPTCLSWANEEGQIGGANGLCDNSDEVAPGTPAKCRCEEAASDIPAPNLQCQAGTPLAPGNVLCTYNGTDVTDLVGGVPAGATVQCSVTVTNSNPNLIGDPCVTDTNIEERFRCGHVGYVQWDVSVTASTGPLPDVANESSTDGFDNLLATDNTLRWRTASGTGGSPGTLGIVQPNETTTLSFDFVVPGGDDNRTFNVDMQGSWSDNDTFAPLVSQGNTLFCTSQFTATPISLAFARVSGFGSRQTLEWTTATEAGNVGFNVLAETADGLVRVNDELIESKAIDSTRPLDYAIELGGVESGRFYLEEVDVTGKTKRHGPFRLGRSYGTDQAPERVDWEPIRAEQERFAERRRDVRVASGAQVGQGGGRFAPVDLRLRQEGVYRVTYEELAAAGFDFAGAPSGALALTHRGQPVPIRLVSSGRGYGFGPGWAIEFFGEAIDSLYTDLNVYRLSVDRQQALRIGTQPAAPTEEPQPFFMASSVREEDVRYAFSSPTGDPWFESRLLARGAPVSESWDFQVDRLVAGGAPARLAVDVWGQSEWAADPDHHVAVLVNLVKVADVRFDGIDGLTIEATLPDGLLREGKNTLTLQVLGDNGSPWDLVNFDGFRVEYPRATATRKGSLVFTAEGGTHRVTGLSSDLAVYRIGAAGVTRLDGLSLEPKAHPSAATFATEPGVRYAVASGNRLTVAEIDAARVPQGLDSGRAEYLIVSHPSFLGGLDPLVRLHESSGLSVKVVDVEDVYAAYSGGIVDVEAIRDFVRFAAFEMGTEYLLLVGADTYDYLDRLGVGSVSFVPTPYAKTDSLIHFAPVDPLYGDVDGDLIPDLSVGRFPVRTLAELELVINKTLEYDVKDYQGTAIFTADRLDSASGVSFMKDAESFREKLGYEAQKAYIDQIGVARARDQVIGAIDQGTALTVFFGHSGPNAWTFDGLFSTAEAKVLANHGRPTVVVQWGCWNTYHVEPTFDTLGHQFLVGGDRGAAAVLGSATLLSTRSEQALAPYLAPRLRQQGLSIGHAVTLAKQQLAASQPNRLDVILGWTILGDPALVIEN
ncbi:MAG TPA: C25 family cysteine peptidase [Thermoanaerobaculia bacterium]|nr:C25 family cysteine peptidase [Thermoanaerobaculia bacterium]